MQQSIECSDHVMDLAFHPQTDVVAGSLITGSIELFNHENENGNKDENGDRNEDDKNYSEKASSPKKASSPPPRSLLTLSHHKESCRTLDFHMDGQLLFTGGIDKQIFAVDIHGQPVWQSYLGQPQSHSAAVHRLKCITHDLVLSGDEDGSLILWDIRMGQPVSKLKPHNDFISDMVLSEDENTILTTSGDGTLGVFNLRKHVEASSSSSSSSPSRDHHSANTTRYSTSLRKKSDEQEDELLSLLIMKQGKNVVTGTQGGVIDIWSWNKWEDISTRFPGHPQSVECMLKVDEDTICTGSSDGILRILEIFPNKLLGVVGDHEGFPVERMYYSRDPRIIGTCSHDNLIRTWDVSFLFDDDDDDGDDDVNDGDDGDDEHSSNAMDEAGNGVSYAAQKLHVSESTKGTFDKFHKQLNDNEEDSGDDDGEEEDSQDDDFEEEGSGEEDIEKGEAEYEDEEEKGSSVIPATKTSRSSSGSKPSKRLRSKKDFFDEM